MEILQAREELQYRFSKEQDRTPKKNLAVAVAVTSPGLIFDFKVKKFTSTAHKRVKI